mmetsp:Transcript_14262/g.21673  ORF Transcript_14262/g.21673 Transcript_14262/m.21673 type:complete len:107 (+) Transcript_14262:30-350(+)|eukprot:CAMPEP_0167742050 /NCGR_PEP_ID=MMETSP0110_2-20121227/1205_1 /TAXON_ID=629695 /ORGANISM="Gymnochlora sp., Strain CCMP2014" /LENGTH=106 /DNA_ID=CAMNT_0007626187 /DNA_START=16 /DNA_END=336 /DNA_ORIENTATION=-
MDVKESLDQDIQKNEIKGELYYPRKCSATNRLIGAKDHAAVQINIGHVDKNGTYTNEYTTFALCGYIRFKGRADDALNRLAAQAGLMKAMDSFPHPTKMAMDGDDE